MGPKQTKRHGPHIACGRSPIQARKSDIPLRPHARNAQSIPISLARWISMASTLEWRQSSPGANAAGATAGGFPSPGCAKKQFTIQKRVPKMGTEIGPNCGTALLTACKAVLKLGPFSVPIFGTRKWARERSVFEPFARFGAAAKDRAVPCEGRVAIDTGPSPSPRGRLSAARPVTSTGVRNCASFAFRLLGPPKISQLAHTRPKYRLAFKRTPRASQTHNFRHRTCLCLRLGPKRPPGGPTSPSPRTIGAVPCAGQRAGVGVGARARKHH